MRTITVNNITKTYKEWSVLMGYKPRYLDFYVRNKGMDEAISRIETFLAGERCKRSRYNITVDGVTKSAAEWSRFLGRRKDYICNAVQKKGIKYTENLIRAILAGETIVHANESCPLEVNGVVKSTHEWSKELGYKSNYINTLARDEGVDVAANHVSRKLKNEVVNHETKYITVNGITGTPYFWAKQIGCSNSYISTIIKEKGYDAAVSYVEKHITGNIRPNYQVHKLTVNGETFTASQWEKKLGFYQGHISRIAKHKGDEVAIEIIKSKLKTVSE